jgi:hypothetical protein
MQQMIFHSKIEIRHPNGHVTNVPVFLSDSSSMQERLEEDERLLTDILDGICPQLHDGTEIFLTIKSKANESEDSRAATFKAADS